MHIRAMFGETLLFMSLIFSATAAQPLTPPAPHAQRISVQTQGAGTDVILIPGLASSREVWADLAAELRKKHRIHLVELAGFANTPAIANPEGKVIAPAAEAIADYIQAQHINAPAIIGHSLGGEIALMLGARYPNLVGRLMIVDALPFYTLMIDPSATSETEERHAAPRRDWLLQQSPEQFEASQQASIARLAMTEAVRPALVAASIRSDRKTVADAVYELMVTDLRPELGRIKAQMEIVYAYDALFGIPATRVEGMYRQAYASAPHIRFTRIDESFHFVMLDQPERFASAVKAFLKE